MSKLNLRFVIRLTMTGQQMELFKNITLIVLVYERFEPSKKKAVVALPYFLSRYFIQCFINAFLSKFFHWSFCWELFFCLTRAMVLKHFFENSLCCNVGWKANGRKLLEPRLESFFAQMKGSKQDKSSNSWHVHENITSNVPSSSGGGVGVEFSSTKTGALGSIPGVDWSFISLHTHSAKCFSLSFGNTLLGH